MQVVIKKFTLMYNGVQYVAGQVADLPDDVAAELVNNAPKEFAMVQAEPQPAKKGRASKKTAQGVEGLPAVDAASLVK